MVRAQTLAVSAAALLLTGCIAVDQSSVSMMAAHDTDAAELIATRQGGMTMSVANLSAIGRAGESDQPLTRAAFPASGLANFAQGLPSLFTPRTRDMGESEALPAIWDDPDSFAAQVAEFQGATAAIEAAARSDDRAAFNAAVDRTRAACQSCHTAFRAE